MSGQHGKRPSCIFYFNELSSSLSSLLLIVLILSVCEASQLIANRFITLKSSSNANTSINQPYVTSNKPSHLVKRSSGIRCYNNTDCSIHLHGSLCVEHTCTCPQGYLPNKEGTIGCFQVGKNLGNFCNISVQCGEELLCRNHSCLCPEGFQRFHTKGTNLCLFWHRPTRLVDHCRSNEDCTPHDSNSICKKRWCQCNIGYQLFETMLFGRKHKCFKAYKRQCLNSSQCTKLAESSDQYCVCHYSFCHCMPNINTTFSDEHDWQNAKLDWLQRWKKDIVLATRLLFITVILFFVPCFIYITLGVRERSRQLFSQFVQPNRSPAVHYSQRRSSHMRSRNYRNPSDAGSMSSTNAAHHVEVSLHSNGVMVCSRARAIPLIPLNCEGMRESSRSQEGDAKEEDAPPTYEEIMQNEIIPEVPPPPYREL